MDTPKTMWGKLFTMLYASFGIPLGLVMFNSIGNFQYFPTKVEKCKSLDKRLFKSVQLYQNFYIYDFKSHLSAQPNLFVSFRSKIHVFN